MPLVVQIRKSEEMKELQQGVGKAQERQGRQSEYLDEFPYIGVHLSIKVIIVLTNMQEGKKEVAAKIVEHPVKDYLIGSREIVEKVQEQVNVITQQYEYFKLKINEYTMST